jgi:hypothetical protein
MYKPRGSKTPTLPRVEGGSLRRASFEMRQEADYERHGIVSLNTAREFEEHIERQKITVGCQVELIPKPGEEVQPTQKFRVIEIIPKATSLVLVPLGSRSAQPKKYKATLFQCSE